MKRGWLVLAFVGCATVQVPFSGARSLQGVDDEGRSPKPHGDWVRSEDDLLKVGLPLAAPDWSKFDLVLVSIGEQGTTGHRASMERITLVDDAIVFDLHHEEPTGSVGEALTFPGVVVQLEKHLERRRRVVRIDGVVVPCTWHAFDTR